MLGHNGVAGNKTLHGKAAENGHKCQVLGKLYLQCTGALCALSTFVLHEV